MSVTLHSETGIAGDHLRGTTPHTDALFWLSPSSDFFPLVDVSKGKSHDHEYHLSLSEKFNKIIITIGVRRIYSAKFFFMHPPAHILISTPTKKENLT